MGRQVTDFSRRQKDIVYGPVNSRRLGPSIGINLFPGRTKKVCPFDCVYCFLKRSRFDSDIPQNCPSPQDIIKELNAFYYSERNVGLSQTARYITFSGNGEPTLHPHFPEIVNRVLEWKNDNADKCKLAIFSNGTQLDRQDIEDSLLMFNKVFLKFEWSSQQELNSIARPRSPINLEKLVKNIAAFSSKSKKQDTPCDVILHAAIYTRGRTHDAWERWAKLVKQISPTEVQLYELVFPGSDYEPTEHFDFHDFQRRIYSLLSDAPFRINFFYSGPFYVSVDLCYAVDSIIYLPLYVADYAKLFQEQGIRVNHFVSPDGDPGAIAAISSGRAQFAICDPLAAIDYLSRERENLKPQRTPKLVAVLIDRVALWAVSEAEEPAKPCHAIRSAKKIITYESGSTASYIWKWQQRLHPLDYNKKLTDSITPGEEFRELCAKKAQNRISLITADLLGARWCSKNCKTHKMSLASYANTRTGRCFLFTGLLASREVIEKYPTCVNAVVKGLRSAINKLNDRVFMRKNRNNLRYHIQNILETKRPWYLLECPVKKKNLASAINFAIDEIQRLSIYSRDGKLKFRQLVNAFKVRQPFSRETGGPSVSDIFSKMDRRAGFHLKLLFWIIPLICWIINYKTARFAVLACFLVILTGVTFWRSSVQTTSWPSFWKISFPVSASLAAAALFALLVSILGKREDEL